MQREHAQHCLVVMSQGRHADEIRWFNGWYAAVLKSAIEMAGYAPLAPSPEGLLHMINDDLLAHLASDPMVVLDLGGMTPEAGPSPHVLYALGMRQALNLPYAMLAWKGQPLPFDGDQARVMLEGRALIDLSTNRARLRECIQAAQEGRWYRPVGSPEQGERRSWPAYQPAADLSRISS